MEALGQKPLQRSSSPDQFEFGLDGRRDAPGVGAWQRDTRSIQSCREVHQPAVLTSANVEQDRRNLPGTEGAGDRHRIIACCLAVPHWGEAPLACARRRMAEELGIRGVALESRETIEYRADVGGGLFDHEVVDIFLAPLQGRPPLWPDPAEVMAVRWVSRADLKAEVEASPDRFTPWLTIYLQEHSARIFGEAV